MHRKTKKIKRMIKRMIKRTKCKRLMHKRTKKHIYRKQKCAMTKKGGKPPPPATGFNPNTNVPQSLPPAGSMPSITAPLYTSGMPNVNTELLTGYFGFIPHFSPVTQETITRSGEPGMLPPSTVYMYDRYDKMPKNQYNKYLRDTYLTTDLTKYRDSVASAKCPTGPGPFIPQAQQTFVANYIQKATPYRGLLLWHGLGSGKTCASILTANNDPDRETIVVAPAALIDNFVGDYVNVCGDLTRFRHKPIDKESGREGRPKHYNNRSLGLSLPGNMTVFSSNGDINNYSSRYKDDFEGLDGKLIIIDEAQVLIEHITNALRYESVLREPRSLDAIRQKSTKNILKSYTDSAALQGWSIRRVTAFRKQMVRLNENLPQYLQFYNDLRSLEKSKILCLSATPIASNFLELAVLFNILHGDVISWRIDLPLADVNHILCTNIGYNRVASNVDWYNSRMISTKPNMCIIYKHPYHFINANICSSDDGIIYDSTGNFLTNEEFDLQLRTIFRGNNIEKRVKEYFNTRNLQVIENMPYDIFRHKINGMVSYFGNIQTLLPTVVLTRGLSTFTVNNFDGTPNLLTVDQSFLNDNNLYNYGIGFSNNSTPLYEIRFVNISPLAVLIKDIFDYAKPNRPFLYLLIYCLGLMDTYNDFVYFDLVLFIIKYLTIIDCWTAVVPDKLPNIVGPMIQLDAAYSGGAGKRKGTSTAPGKRKRPALAPATGAPTAPAPAPTAIPGISSDFFGAVNKADINSVINLIDPTSTISVMNNVADASPEIYDKTRIKDPINYYKPIVDASYNCGSPPSYLSKDLFNEIYKTIGYIWNDEIFEERYKIQSVNGGPYDHNIFEYDYNINLNNTSTQLNMLKLCSPKMYEIIKCIKTNMGKIHIIYSESNRVNIALARMLQANGYKEYDYEEELEKNTGVSGFPANKEPRYMFYTGTSEFIPELNQVPLLLNKRGEGKVKNNSVRTSALKEFNKKENNKGEYIQIIIYNSAAAEGVTIKNVRYIHLLDLPPNMSKIFQIIGRGIRNCTHETLKDKPNDPPDQNPEMTTTPILYLDQKNQEKYSKIIRDNQHFVGYLNIIKEASIDCLLNKQIDSRLNCFIDRPISTLQTTNVGVSLPPPWEGFITETPLPDPPPPPPPYFAP